MTQQNMSLLEQKEEVDDKLLEKVAKALNVPVEAIRNLSDEATINYINTFNDNQGHGFFSNNTNCTFNPIEKIVQLYDEKIALYERMLKEKDALLEKLLKGK